jgi:hypothetical protein
MKSTICPTLDNKDCGERKVEQSRGSIGWVWARQDAILTRAKVDLSEKVDLRKDCHHRDQLRITPPNHREEI